MTSPEIRKRTMGAPVPTAAVRVERLPFDLDEYRSMSSPQNFELAADYRNGRAAFYRIARLCEACPHCGPVERDPETIFLSGDVRTGDVPADEIERDEIRRWLAEQVEFDQYMINEALDLLRRPPSGRKLPSGHSAAFVLVSDELMLADE